MKLILTGASGFIGGEILTQALAHPTISSIIALSRKPLTTTHPKLTTVILKDFTSYPPEILDQLAGADACIWTVGAKSTSPETTRKVTVEYTLAAAKAFSELAKKEGKGKKFHFVFTSGVLAVTDQQKHLWFASEARKVAGEAETRLLELAQENPQSLETFVARPAYVLRKEKSVVDVVTGAVLGGVMVDVLAASLIDIAFRGGEVKTLENKMLVERGREVLKSAGTGT